MSLLNPGKRGIYTLLSVLLIIGIPGAIAYADDSSDTYYSAVSVDAPDYFIIYDADSHSKFAVTASEEDGSYICLINDTDTSNTVSLSELSPVTQFTVDVSTDFSSVSDVSKMTFNSGIEEVTGVSVLFFDSNASLLLSRPMVADDSGVYSYELTSVEKITVSDFANLKFVVTVDADSYYSSVELAYAVFQSNPIFTEDVTELLVLVGGILLLVLGTMALSFFDVSTPGKAFRSAGRSVKNITRRK